MKIKVNDIKVNPNRRPVDGQVADQLAESIAKIGLINPITVDKNYVLIAGNHRYQAHRILGEEYIEATVIDADALIMELIEIDENFVRNDLHWTELDPMLKRRKQIYLELHPETAHGGDRKSEEIKTAKCRFETPTSFTADTAAKTGKSVTTIERAIQRAENIVPEVLTVLKSQDATKTEGTKIARLEPVMQVRVAEILPTAKSVDKAIAQIRTEDKKEAIAQKFADVKPSSASTDIHTTNKRYSIIYADPAWSYWDGGQKNQSLHYATMSIEEICNLPVDRIAAKDCILFIWVTYPILPQSLEVIKAWGFEYSTCGFVWVKKNKVADSYFFGNGSWTRANTELCLIAKRGKVDRLDASISQIIDEPIQEHSKKPDIVRSKITQLVGNLPRIELFSRNTADGWDAWGNEV